jgi:nitronate monooxygenase
MDVMQLPVIIQGGMGVGVSGWRLARAVAMQGQLGVVAGTALATTLVRRLQLGDEGGHLRRAMAAFPEPEAAKRILDRYFTPSPRPGRPFKSHPLPTMRSPRRLLELTVVASFAEVYLAREGHTGSIGVNLLEKVQLPTLATLFGCMLAGVDYVLMGAGIPRAIPAVLDRLAAGERVELALDVAGAEPGERFVTTFDPAQILHEPPATMKRPAFFAIVSSATLAATLAKKSSGRVDGLIIEGPTAGGHNAPPRGELQLSAAGEPVYGPRDVPDIARIVELGLPFWMAGSYGRPGKLAEAQALGATGIQVGTAFAFCEESGIRADLKEKVIRDSQAGRVRAITDHRASPTGFPLKIVQIEGTVSEADVYEARPKICDLGYLRRAYRRPDGTVGERCPGEPVADFLAKGGKADEIAGRKCVCNGLLATVGLGQNQKHDYAEPPMVTAGYDIAQVADFLPPGRTSYSAADVIRRLLSAGAAATDGPAG